MSRRNSFRVGIPIAALFLLGLLLSFIIHPFTIGHSGLLNTRNMGNSNVYYLLHLNHGQGWQTSISITNPEYKSKHRRIDVTLTAYNKDGASLGVIPDVKRLKSGETKTIDTQDLPQGAESLKVESDGNLLCNTLFKMADGIKSEVIPAVREPSKHLDFPALLHSYNDLNIYKTINLLNPTNQPVTVDIIALDRDGHEIDHNVLPSLSPMESKTFSVAEIFDPRILKDLSTVRIVSDGEIMGLQLVAHPDSDLVGLPALTVSSRSWMFPIVTKGYRLALWTIVGVLNPGEDTASITVEAFDTSSNSLGIIDIRNLSPGATHLFSTVNISNGIIPSETAFLKIASNQPVSGYEVIGVVDGNGLAAIMGIPEEELYISGLDLVGLADGNTLKIYTTVGVEDGKVMSLIGVVVEGEWREAIQIPDNSLNKETTNLGGVDTSGSLLANVADCFQCFPQLNTSGLPQLSWPLEGDKAEYIWFPWDYYPWKGGAQCGGDYKKHAGLDISLKSGSIVGKKVFPAYEGKVKEPTFNAGAGWASGVVIEHTDSNNNKFTTTYMHINPVTLTSDQYVTNGTAIGTVAAITKGKPHLHFSIRRKPYDKSDVTSRRGALPIVNQDNLCKCKDAKENTVPVFPEYFVNPATIFLPDASFTLISPNGGEAWQAGSTQTIKWSYTGYPGNFVKIELLNGVKKGKILIDSASIGSNGNGLYNWTIPKKQTAGSNYKIRITSTSPSLQVMANFEGSFCL